MALQARLDEHPAEDTGLGQVSGVGVGARVAAMALKPQANRSAGLVELRPYLGVGVDRGHLRHARRAKRRSRPHLAVVGPGMEAEELPHATMVGSRRQLMR